MKYQICVIFSPRQCCQHTVDSLCRIDYFKSPKISIGSRMQVYITIDATQAMDFTKYYIIARGHTLSWN